MGHNAEVLRQAQVVQGAAPEELRPALAALERLLVVTGSDLGETDRAQLLADVQALLARDCEGSWSASRPTTSCGAGARARPRRAGPRILVRQKGV